ncbi:MAG TPA: HNH endonuclease [Acidimicrobiales bacterium]
MSNLYGKGPRGKATMLHSQLVRLRGACERCGRSAGVKLECAHIISRRYASTRTDERNAWCLCSACHRRLTEWPFEHVAFAVATIGQETYDELKAKALTIKKVDWEAEVVRLSALLREAA